MPDIFLKFDPEIEGGSDNLKFAKAIEIQSFAWGVTNLPFDGKSDPPSAAQAVSLVAPVDRQSPRLFEACAAGTPFTSAELSLVSDGDEQVFYKVLFGDVLISSYQVSGADGPAAPFESFSLNYTRIENEFRAERPDGTLEPPIRGTWDFAAAKKV